MLVKFEQNRMLRTILIIELFDKKMVNHFWQSVDAILGDVSVTETIMLNYIIDLRGSQLGAFDP